VRCATCRIALVALACVLSVACGSRQPRARSAPVSTTVSPTTTTAVPRRAAHRIKKHPNHHIIKVPVTAIGDSVMLDAAPALRREIPAITIDAAVNRSALPGPGLLAAFAQSGRLGRSIIIDLGTNGGMSMSIIDAMLHVAAGRRVVMVTNHCTFCSSIAAGNAVIRSSCTRTRNCFVADWDGLARVHPTWFDRDGVHMAIGGAGAAAYAHLVRARLSM
jgi:hypothetical protein